YDNWSTSLKSIPHSNEIASLPEHFDARDYFSQCSDVISRIGDQGNCGSCWTFGVAFAISDRICIASNGQQKPWISTQDLMECMNDYRNNGCQGGWSNDAWNFYATNGIVTGSGSDIEKGCKPNIFSDKKIAYVSFSCTLNCESSEVLSAKHDDESKMKQYLKDKHFGAGLVTTISSKDSDHINKIKLEMYKNGPVTALMFVPEKTERQKFETDAKLGLIYSNDAVNYNTWGFNNAATTAEQQIQCFLIYESGTQTSKYRLYDIQLD
ncbi:PREDICTED: cathepsin B-like cysteine proteinase 3, partial [Rhagoletis zephyria]|uniref:cathepsin B-like cysteine proteinase 3 n=1 Tax=Rhagoletis zephyria TaxID=28612 RepID=UPI000811A9F1